MVVLFSLVPHTWLFSFLLVSSDDSELWPDHLLDRFRQLINVRSEGGHADCLVEIDPHCQSHTDTRILAGVLSGAAGMTICPGEMRTIVCWLEELCASP